MYIIIYALQMLTFLGIAFVIGMNLAERISKYSELMGCAYVLGFVIMAIKDIWCDSSFISEVTHFLTISLSSYILLRVLEKISPRKD